MRPPVVPRLGVVLAAVLIIGLISSCAPEPPPRVLGIGDCIPIKTMDGTPPFYFRWDGQYGTDTHVVGYADATCTTITPRGVVNYFTVVGPSMTLPPGRTTWSDATFEEIRTSMLDVVPEATLACKAAVPGASEPGATTDTYVGPFVPFAATDTSLPLTLWGCMLAGPVVGGYLPSQPRDPAGT